MVDRGELPGEVVASSGPLGDVRRRYRLGRADVDAFIERSRVRPGELDHLLYGPDNDQAVGNDGGMG